MKKTILTFAALAAFVAPAIAKEAPKNVPPPEVVKSIKKHCGEVFGASNYDAVLDCVRRNKAAWLELQKE